MNGGLTDRLAAEDADASADLPVGRRTARSHRHGSRLLASAWRNLRRRLLYTTLSVVGIAAAMAVAIVMQTIATGFQVNAVSAYETDVGNHAIWILPAGGVTFNPALGAMLPNGAAPAFNASKKEWQVAETLGGSWKYHGVAVAIFASTADRSGVAGVSPAAGKALGLVSGKTINIGGRTLAVRAVPGTGLFLRVPAAVARAIGIKDGWLTAQSPSNVLDVSAAITAATGLPVTPDPATKASATRGIAYTTTNGLFSFDQRISAAYSGTVNSSIIGITAKVALLLGFIISLTSFLAAVQERRREFGIMCSLGLTDEVFYFFLMEALIIFAAAYVLGVAMSAVIIFTLLPAAGTLSNIVQAAALTLIYLPTLAIFAAVFPAHRLIEERPAQLLSPVA
jgi:putative ABC transport system permease protein